MQTAGRVRIDKWLWAVRLFKSRSLATVACNAGHVKIAGQNVKPSRPLQVGEIISARTGHVNRTIRVLALLERRVGAKVASEFLEDQTPMEEYARAKEEAARASAHHGGTFGRPTKLQRRQWKGAFEPES
jgi:ribosome-associated heat shock protein Hsp15